MESGIFETKWVEPVADFIVYLLSHEAVLAPILLLTVEESGLPLPVPGDVIIAYTGYNIRRGLLPYGAALAAIMAAILLGSTILYWISRRWGNLLVLKFGRFLHLTPQKLDTVERKFRHYGPLVIIFGRHIPGFRIPITVFSGMSKISYKTFIISTLISTLFWAMFYLDLGIRLGAKVTAFLRFSASRWLIIPGFILVALLAYLYFRGVRKNKR